MAICGIIRLLITLDSTAVRVRSVMFHKVKAIAVLTTANQAMITQSCQVIGPKPCVINPMINKTRESMQVDDKKFLERLGIWDCYYTFPFFSIVGEYKV